MLRQAANSSTGEFAPSEPEPISLVLNPRTLTVSSFEATILETVTCLPPGEQPPYPDPRYADNAVDTVQSRRFEIEGPVKPVRANSNFALFKFGRGRVVPGSPDDNGDPGSWQFSLFVDRDPVGNPGSTNRLSQFVGQTAGGSLTTVSTESEGGRCRTRNEYQSLWNVRGPSLTRLRVRTSVARVRDFVPSEPYYRLTVQVIDRRGRPVSRALVTVVDPPAPSAFVQNSTTTRRRADRQGRATVVVGSYGSVSVTGQARGFFGRTCRLRVNQARPAASRLRC